MKNASRIDTILFDLDGTLLDTAPDLITALNFSLEQAGYRPLAEDTARPLISRGARPMLMAGLGEHADEQLLEQLLASMLGYYETHIADQTRFFDGMEGILECLEQQGLPWGIVTNKRTHYTRLLLKQLDLLQRPACIICGDTMPQAKPHPAPLQEASRQTGRPVDQCLFIGDSPLDIQAGIGAGMSTLAASYGYVPADDDPATWGACGLLASPAALRQWLPALVS